MRYKTPWLKPENNIENPLEKGGVNAVNDPNLPRKPDFPEIGIDDITQTTQDMIKDSRRIVRGAADEAEEETVQKHITVYKGNVLGINEAFIGESSPGRPADSGDYIKPIEPEVAETVTGFAYAGFVNVANNNFPNFNISGMPPSFIFAGYETSEDGSAIAFVLDERDINEAIYEAARLLNDEQYGSHLILPYEYQYEIRTNEIVVHGGLISTNLNQCFHTVSFEGSDEYKYRLCAVKEVSGYEALDPTTDNYKYPDTSYTDDYWMEWEEISQDPLKGKLVVSITNMSKFPYIFTFQ